MAQHLENCAVYQDTLTASKKNDIHTQNKLSFIQQPIRPQSLSKEQMEKLKKKAGYAIYCGARPFSMYIEPYMKDFILELEPAFAIPSDKTFSITILDLCYKETRSEVLDILWHICVLN